MSSARDLGKSAGRVLRALRDRGGDSRPRPEPACEFGLVVNERLADLQRDVAGIKRLLRWLLVAVFGALIGLVADLLGAI